MYNGNICTSKDHIVHPLIDLNIKPELNSHAFGVCDTLSGAVLHNPAIYPKNLTPIKKTLESLAILIFAA